MSLLSKEEIEALPPGIYVTRKCDWCRTPIMQSHSYVVHFKGEDYDFEKRRCQINWETENLNLKGKRSMSKKDKSKKRREEEDDEEETTKKKKKRSREDDDEDEDDDDDDDTDADDDDDDDDDKKKSKKKKSNGKSKDKGKDKSSKSSKKDKKSDKKAGAGGYRAGSNSAIMFERLADQKRHTFKEVFKGIDSPLPTLRRLERHAKKFKKFSLDVDRENETIRMKKR